MFWKCLGLAGALALVAPLPARAQAHAYSHGSGALSARRIPLSTGVELQVVEAGSPDGRPVLFLHGITDSWYSFSRILDRLPAGVRAIIPSQRGHGDSARPTCCYATHDFAADAVALLDALGVRRATVVGHSNGSFVAQRIAIEYAERVDGLVLVGSGNTYATPVVRELGGIFRDLEDPVPPAFIREFQSSTAARPIPDSFLDTVVAESGKVPARVWRDALTGFLASDAADELSRIRVPTLVLWGDRDEIFPRPYQDELVRGIPGARLHVYAGTGHAPHWEEPDRFVADLRAFLWPAADGPARDTSGSVH